MLNDGAELGHAQSGAPESDYSVCTTWKVYGEQFYLVDLFRQRLTYPDLKRAAIEQAARHKPNYVLIEDIGSGMSLIQDLTKERPPHCANPIPIKVKLDKLTRAAQQSATVESQRVYLPAKADWVDTLLHELMLFPGGRNDDQVDSFSQFLNWRIHEHIEWATNIKVTWAQARHLGGLSSETRKALKLAVARVAARLQSKNRADDAVRIEVGRDDAGDAQLHNSPSPARSLPRPGARLIREWNGKANVVDVIQGGYLFEGKSYRSLSAIARQITNAHWSGPRFFGL